MIYADEILLIDRDGDILSLGGDPLDFTDGKTAATPVLTVTRGAKPSEVAEGGVINSGQSTSVFVSPDEMRDKVLPELVRRYFGVGAVISISEAGA